MAVTLGQLPVGVTNLIQAEGLRDGNLEASVGHKRRELGEQPSGGDRVRALCVDAETLHRVVVDDRVDPLRGDAQPDGQIDVAPTEGVDEGVDPALGCVRILSAWPSP